VLKTIKEIGMNEFQEEKSLEGKKFRQIMQSHFDEKTFKFINKESETWFKQTIYPRSYSMHRCTPMDKLIYITAMRLSGSCIAYVGDSPSDANALSAANVGFAMKQSGCAMTEYHAHITILDDNFSSVKSSLIWGRQIFDNARRFI